MLKTIFTQSDLLELSKKKAFPSISIFMPTHPVGDDSEPDSIIFKKLWRQVDDILSEHRMRPREREEIYSMLSPYTEDSMFWSYQREGLALFVCPDFVRVFKMPIAVPELVVVCDHFEIKPALPLFMTKNRYFVLGLTLEKPRIFEGSSFGLKELESQSLPLGLQKNVLVLLQTHKSLQVHSSGAPQPVAPQPGVFHSHDPSELDKVRIEEFLRHVNDGVVDLLKDEKAPLVLVGVEYLQAIYRRLNKYGNLLAEGVLSNADKMKTDEIESAVKPILSRYWQDELQRVFEEYGDGLGSGLARSKLDDLLPAAHSGQLSFCMVAAEKYCWGAYDHQSASIELASDSETPASGIPGPEDLLDLLCVQTLKHGGRAFVLPEKQMPEGKSAAGVLRY